MAKHKNQRSKKGSILITVMIVIGVATTLAMYIFERSTTSYGTVIDLQTEYQGAIYAMTATKALEAVFKYDRNAYDAKTDIWNLIPTIPVKDGFLSIYITPLNSKFPINALSIDNDTERKRFEVAFEKLLKDKNMDSTMMTDISSWMGKGTITAERIDESSSPYSFKGGAIESLAELQFVPSVKTSYRELSKFTSMGDTNYKLNMNLADQAVILAIMPELSPYISSIMTERDGAGFTDVSDIYKVLGGNNQELYNTLLKYFDVKSVYFYVKLELSVGTTIKYYHILFQKNGSSASVVKYIEGGNIEYF